MTVLDIILQVAQVLAVLLLASLIQGIIVQFEERIQRAQGAGIFQPYRDLWMLFHKQIVVPETASWLYWTTPVVASTAMLTVPILIPVLTAAGRLRLQQSGHLNFYPGLIGFLLVIIPGLTLL
jgi:formate hydrogenlyase subunit 4